MEKNYIFSGPEAFVYTFLKKQMRHKELLKPFDAQGVFPFWQWKLLLPKGVKKGGTLALITEVNGSTSV